MASAQEIRDLITQTTSGTVRPRVELAKLCGVEPRAYLGEAARRAIRSPGEVTLPRDLKRSES